MEPLVVTLLSGLLGGCLLALLIALSPRRTRATFVPRRLEMPSPSLINMAHIRVEGLGGLGMLAAVVAVAIADSRIRIAILLAALLGTGMALALIAMRRRTGAVRSGGDGPDDRSLLHLNVWSGPVSGGPQPDEQTRVSSPGRLSLHPI
jgi:hypothetical protein